MADFEIKQGDRLPVFEQKLVYSSGAVVPLTGISTFMFAFRRAGTSAPLFVRAAEIINVTTGLVRYSWQAGDTDTPGGYEGEWRILYTDGKALTVPNNRHVTIRVQPDLG